MANSPDSPDSQDPSRQRWMLQKGAVAAAFFAGLALSPRLWSSVRAFPLVPVIPGLPALPPPADLLAYAALLACLTAIGFAARPARWIAGFVAIFLVLAIGDQMRWQPWAYQYLWMLGALGLYGSVGRFSAGLNTCRLILVCTYLWSGLQKLVSDFIDVVFPFIIQPFTTHLPDAVARAVMRAGWVAAVLETAFGLALLVPRLRRFAIIGAIAMHLFLLLTLGPWGQNSNSVIWPWNIAMILFLLILFANTKVSAREILLPGATPSRNLRRDWFPKLALVMLGLLPALSLFNRWDSYLSFALYSGFSNIDYVRVSDSLALRLPKAIQLNVYRTNTPGVNQLRLINWSYAVLNVPVNPEPRVYRAIGRYLCSFEQAPEELQLFIYGRHRLLPAQKRLDYGCKDLK